jgi:hypothetical protein
MSFFKGHADIELYGFVDTVEKNRSSTFYGQTILTRVCCLVLGVSYPFDHFVKAPGQGECATPSPRGVLLPIISSQSPLPHPATSSSGASPLRFHPPTVVPPPHHHLYSHRSFLPLPINQNPNLYTGPHRLTPPAPPLASATAVGPRTNLHRLGRIKRLIVEYPREETAMRKMKT